MVAGQSCHLLSTEYYSTTWQSCQRRCVLVAPKHFFLKKIVRGVACSSLLHRFAKVSMYIRMCVCVCVCVCNICVCIYVCACMCVH